MYQVASVIARVLEVCQAVAEAGVQALVLKEVRLLPAIVRFSVNGAKLTAKSPYLPCKGKAPNE